VRRASQDLGFVMGDRRAPTPPPIDQRKPDPPPPPPRKVEPIAGYVAAELQAAHETLDRFGVARTAVAAWSRRGRAEMYTLSLAQRIEAMHRNHL